MKHKNIKLQLIYYIESLLKVRPIITTALGKDFFYKEYEFLEYMIDKIDDVDLSESELKRIEQSTKDFLTELKKCILRKNILRCLLN